MARPVGVPVWRRTPPLPQHSPLALTYTYAAPGEAPDSRHMHHAHIQTSIRADQRPSRVRSPSRPGRTAGRAGPQGRLGMQMDPGLARAPKMNPVLQKAEYFSSAISESIAIWWHSPLPYRCVGDAPTPHQQSIRRTLPWCLADDGDGLKWFFCTHAVWRQRDI